MVVSSSHPLMSSVFSLLIVRFVSFYLLLFSFFALFFFCAAYMSFSFFFFFFQAEDGIRDRDVTGVQTCALPISGFTKADVTKEISFLSWLNRLSGVSSPEISFVTSALVKPAAAAVEQFAPRMRSEERRVGKECRARWSAYQEKKKREKKREERIS